MGLGDDVMASAAAERIGRTGKKAVFGNGLKTHWSEVFENNPHVAKYPSVNTVWVEDFPGKRPYIDLIDGHRYILNPDYRARYGYIYLTDEELAWAEEKAPEDFILVEPEVKIGMLTLGLNKSWPYWKQLFKLDRPWLQIGTAEPKVRQVRTESFRHALAMVARAKLVVTTDGALHHAAAALGVPAIVLWGGVAGPRTLGYPTHHNIWNGTKPCGTFLKECPHCREAMASISVDQVTKFL